MSALNLCQAVQVDVCLTSVTYQFSTSPMDTDSLIRNLTFYFTNNAQSHVVVLLTGQRTCDSQVVG